MPLHLLGKKSWNVYNKDNIERVRRDEAAVAAREAAAEQRMQDEDARRRLQILRGEAVDPLPPPPSSTTDTAAEPDAHVDRDSSARHDRKRRRLRGEDDTDRDMRYAREDRARAAAKAEESAHLPASDAPLVDHHGHIALFTPEDAGTSRRHAPRKPDAAARPAADADPELHAMRFADAAGFKQDAGAKPWYSSGDTAARAPPPDLAARDVWGNADPRRAGREQTRLAASDPLLAMQRGVQGVRKAEQAKRTWRAEREREVGALIAEERRAARRERRGERRRRSRSPSKSRSRSRERRAESASDSLEDFRLDTAAGSGRVAREEHKREPQRERKRDRERKGDRDRHRHQHRHRHHHHHHRSHRTST